MIFRIGRFTGLDQAENALLTDETRSPDARNMDTSGGALAVAAGYVPYTSQSLAGGIGAIGVFYQRVAGQTQPRLVAVNEGGIFEWTTGGWLEQYRGAGRAQAAMINYQKDGKDVLLLADGQRDVLMWDGISPIQALNGCGKKFSQLALNYERVWGAGVTGEPDSVFWSRAFDPADWSGDADNPDTAGGEVQIPTWNGGSVRKIMTLFDDVLVFKDADLYRIVGTYPGNYEVVRVHGIVGPIAPESCVSSGDACYFLSRDGLCVYNGVTAQPISDRRAQRFFTRINADAAAGACAVVHKGKLYLAAPLDAAVQNNAVLEYDLAKNTFMERDGIAVRQFLSFGEKLLFSAGRTVYEYGAGTDLNGAAIQAYWETPNIDGQHAGSVKYLRRLDMQACGRLAVCTWIGGTENRYLLELGAGIRHVRIPLRGKGESFRLRFENVDGSDFTILPGVTVTVEDDQ